MSNLFEINLVCLDGGDHFMEKDTTATGASDGKAGTSQAPPADFIRTPVSAGDQLDVAEAGGVVDFDLDDEYEEDEDEGISDNDDSDDTAPAVEETPKHDYNYHDPWAWHPHDIVLHRETLEKTNAPTEFPAVTRPTQRRLSILQTKKPWHIQLLDSLVGPSSQAPYNFPTYPGGGMTYEEAIRSSGGKRRPRRTSNPASPSLRPQPPLQGPFQAQRQQAAKPA